MIKRRMQGTNGVTRLKIDVSKAYNRLEWDYVECMLEKFGFYELWIKRVMTCIRIVSYGFIQHGEVFGDVRPQRGIRQGDPIFPYLYILCAEGLSSIIRKNEEVGLIHGCKIARGAQAVSHLLFADDCYFFFKAKESEARVMKSIIQRYEMLSGQAINFNKSIITFSPNTPDESRQVMCGILEIEERPEPGKYLGLPMTVGRKKNEVFSFLSDQIRQKLQGCRNKALSKGGNCLLLKSVAQTIPNFWMNLLTIPSEICKTIQRQMNGFLWCGVGNNKRIRWMSWERLCEVKDAGGLGFKDFRSSNIAMLAKQGWRLINDSNPLVTNIMKAKYFPQTDFLNAKVGRNPSYMWRSIMAAPAVLKQGCRRKIGTGDDTFI